MKWLKRNFDDLWTIVIIILCVGALLFFVKEYIECLPYRGMPITEIPAYCVRYMR